VPATEHTLIIYGNSLCIRVQIHARTTVAGAAEHASCMQLDNLRRSNLMSATSCKHAEYATVRGTVLYLQIGMRTTYI
jgi:hypothetical protein